MSNRPRKHHYVPQFYLAGFTDSGTVDGSLYVLDTHRLKVWKRKPKDVAHQRDFYEIDGGSGGDPMVVEKMLGECEGKWSAVLRTVIEHEQIPTDDRFGDLMMLIAFMAVRVPRIRSTISSFLEDVRRQEEFAQNWLRQQGEQVETASETEVDKCDQTWHVRQMVMMAAALAPILSLRTWQLRTVDQKAPDLICSDSPVALTWATAVSVQYPPGFALKNTVVSVPLHKRFAMVGVFDVGVDRRKVEECEVARLYSATGMHAGQLYASAPDFVWWVHNGAVGRLADLLDLLKASNPKQSSEQLPGP